MCFIEFVGYTCGHTSLPVIRACPLTTASHTFPTCPRRGDKAFFAGEMCSACQRIIHSRATQIEEYEHRFMHERGVCGCETVFPYLIRPRVIGSCGGGGGDISGGCDDENFGCGGHAGHHEEQDDYNSHETALPSKIELPPLLCEAMDDSGRAMVSVRLPSLYAAEWVADHRARHDERLCDCRVDFRTYHKAKMDGVNENDLFETTQQQKSSHPSHPIRRMSSMSAMSSISQDKDDNDDGTEARPKGHTRSSSHSDFSYFMADNTQECGVGNEDDTASKADMNTGLSVPGSGSSPRRPFLPPHLGQPVRHAGAVFAKVPEYLKLMGPFLAQPSPFSHETDQQPMFDGVFAGKGSTMRRKGQSSTSNVPPPGAALRQSRAQAARDHHAYQASQKTPLVGFPIGAGPEGVPHATPWRNRHRCWNRSQLGRRRYIGGKQE
ncbi:hypothetical protein SBRCBS47491_000049 [Sporothrix bragantina]|uniref:C2H2-type domain-containing protein n=1 Tax=Sporothrix bragantina TaxID=671064 RepID=A0ABP0ALY0_9PEZI